MIDLILLIAALILSVNSLINKELADKINYFTIQLYSSIFSIFLIPIWYFLSQSHLKEEIVSIKSVFLIFLSSALNVLVFIIILFCLKFKPAYYVNFYLSIYPIFVLIYSCLIGLEKFTLNKLLAIIFISIGIFFLRKQ